MVLKPRRLLYYGHDQVLTDCERANSADVKLLQSSKLTEQRSCAALVAFIWEVRIECQALDMHDVRRVR
jgi:hypothetical protein